MEADDKRAAERAAQAAAEAASAAKAAAREASITLAQLQVQGAARLDVMDELTELLAEARTELRGALETVDGMATVEDVRYSAEATRAEQARRRRLTVVRVSAAVVWLVLGWSWVVNQQVEHCSPGSRALRVTSELTRPRADLTFDRLQAAARRPAPTWCDVALPTTAHSPLTEWPTKANLAGLALVLLLAVGTGVVIRHRGWEDDPPPVVGDVPSAA